MKALALGVIVSFMLITGDVRGAESVRFAGFEGFAESPTANPATFGNRARAIDIEVDGGTGVVGALRADLFQVAGQLAIPLVKDIELQKGVTLGAITRLRVSLKFPAVLRLTEILVRFKLEPGNGQMAQAIGDLCFEVFPQSTTRDLVAVLQAKDDASRVEVFGAGRKLREFLTYLHVPFEDGGEDAPDNFSTNRIYIGELADSAQFQQVQDRSPNARILVFAPDESLPPGVYLDRSGAHAMGHVTAPLLDNLADDPRAQLALTKIFTLLSSTTTNPSSL